MRPDETLIVEKLSKRYSLSGGRSVQALDEVSFAAQAGTVLGIVGANGAGKSTLLKVLARVTLPTGGRAVVRGRVVSLLELGGVAQKELSGEENVELNAALHGIPRSTALRRMDEIFEFAGLEEFRNVPVKRYSSGMYVRLAFSVAINMEPDVLLADEVLAVGDLSFQQRCLERVERAGEEGVTVLFVSHDLGAVRRLCSRALWLDRGRIITDSKPDVVLNEYETFALEGMRREAPALQEGASARIVGVRLQTPEGDEIATARTVDDLDLVVDFEAVRSGGYAQAAVGLDADGVAVFRALQDEPVELVRPGQYRVAVRIPGHLLADRVYTVKASVVIDREGRRETSVWPNALTFRLYEGGAERHEHVFGGPRPGLVQPRLQWRAVETPAKALRA